MQDSSKSATFHHGISFGSGAAPDTKGGVVATCVHMSHALPTGIQIPPSAMALSHHRLLPQPPHGDIRRLRAANEPALLLCRREHGPAPCPSLQMLPGVRDTVLRLWLALGPQMHTYPPRWRESVVSPPRQHGPRPLNKSRLHDRGERGHYGDPICAGSS